MLHFGLFMLLGGPAQFWVSYYHGTIIFMITYRIFYYPSKIMGKIIFLFTLSFLYLYSLPSFHSCCLSIPFTYEFYNHSSPPFFLPSSLPTLKHLFFQSFISFLLLSPSLFSPVFLSHPCCLPILLSHSSPHSLVMAEHG